MGKQRTNAVMLASTLALLLFAQNVFAEAAKFGKAEFMPPKVEGSKNKKGGDPVKGVLSFDRETKTMLFVDEKGTTLVSVPYDKIKHLLYEKTSRPRYAEAILISPLFLFSKTKKHFLTIQYTNPAGDGQFVMIHMDKSNARDIVAEAEAQTGQKVDTSEER